MCDVILSPQDQLLHFPELHSSFMKSTAELLYLMVVLQRWHRKGQRTLPTSHNTNCLNKYAGHHENVRQKHWNFSRSGVNQR